jgi:hypothetical protein
MRLFHAALCLVAAQTAGCGAATEPGNGGKTSWVRCAEVADCGDGERCVSGGCQPQADPGSPRGSVTPQDPSTQPGTPEPSAVIAPNTSWLLAFQTGFNNAEELWLLPEAGEPVRVIGPEGAPPDGIFSVSTLGYAETSGRIGDVLFDSELGQLLVSVQLESGFEVRALDLTAGTWSTLGSSQGQPSIIQTELGALVALPSEGALTLFAERSGSLELAWEGAGPGYIPGRDLHRYALGGSERIYVHNGPHLERSGAGFVPALFPEPVPEQLDWFKASPTGSHSCATAGDSAWLIGRDGALQLEMLPTPLGGCQFANQGQLLLVGSGYAGASSRSVFDLQGQLLTSFENLDYQVDGTGRGYATRGMDVVAVDWTALQSESLQFSEAGVSPFAGSTIWLMGDAILVEQHTGCTDCHASALWVLPLAGGPAVLALAANEWYFLQTAVLKDGSAVFTRNPDESDRLFRVDAQGRLSELGPFAGVKLPHAPLAL